jgi:MinD superfamily P-loop ATPase
MWKNHWWKSSKNQCRKCGRFNAEKLVKETWKFIYWKCEHCGFSRRHEKCWAIYKHKDGKTFLKRNGWKEFKEVVVARNKKGVLRVVPITEITKQRVLI